MYARGWALPLLAPQVGGTAEVTKGLHGASPLVALGNDCHVATSDRSTVSHVELKWRSCLNWEAERRSVTSSSSSLPCARREPLSRCPSSAARCHASDISVRLPAPCPYALGPAAAAAAAAAEQEGRPPGTMGRGLSSTRRPGCTAPSAPTMAPGCAGAARCWVVGAPRRAEDRRPWLASLPDDPHVGGGGGEPGRDAEGL